MEEFVKKILVDFYGFSVDCSTDKLIETLLGINKRRIFSNRKTNRIIFKLTIANFNAKRRAAFAALCVSMLSRYGLHNLSEAVQALFQWLR